MYYNTILPKRKVILTFFVQYTLNIFYHLPFLVVSQVNFMPMMKKNSARDKNNVEKASPFCYNEKVIFTKENF